MRVARSPCRRPGADYVLTNGKVYTVNEEQPWAEAIAIRGGEIVCVSDAAGATALVGEATEEIDLGGRLTLPGFVESHVHPTIAAAYASGTVLNFSDPMEVVLEKVKAYAEANPDKEAVFGATYNGGYLNPPGNYKKMLDDVVPDRPVYLLDHGGHGAWVNSKTLEALGYRRCGCLSRRICRRSSTRTATKRSIVRCVTFSAWPARSHWDGTGPRPLVATSMG